MTRFLLLLTVGLLAGTLYSQDCPTLTCSPLTYTPLPNENGECRWPIPALHFTDNDFTDCSDPLRIAIYRQSEVIAAGDQFVPEFNGRDTLWYAYPDDEETTVVRIFLEDNSGIIQECETYLLIQMGVSIECFTVGDPIAGAINTEADEPIANVTVDMVFVDGVLTSAVTNTDGSYLFPDLLISDNLTITPSRLDNPLNGVSTFDLVLISKHILGLQPLDSPYKRIAADVNGSGTITVLDLIQIRKLILNLINTFPNTPSWRFIPAHYAFPAPLNPWYETFPETITITDPLNFISGDFVGIKIGDVNGSAETQ